MHIHLHDFSGHPFQAQLARELAHRAHSVDFSYSNRYASGKGRLQHKDGDSTSLRFLTIDAGTELQKYNAVRRLGFEIQHTRAWIRALRRSKSDLVVACNVPLISLWIFSLWAAKNRIRWILWHQDIFSAAMSDELRVRLPKIVALTGASVLDYLEKRVVKRATRVITIGDAFTRKYQSWKVDMNKVRVIPNWAPLDEIFPADRNNAWSVSKGLNESSIRLLYAGTLGRKHNPLLLAELARQLKNANVDIDFTVASEGDGADMLAAEASTDIRFIGFQPADQLGAMLGSADVLLVLLEPNASEFSIPSKVLSYLAAGRPILGFMPRTNPAALDVEEAGGFVVEPNSSGVALGVQWLKELSNSGQSAVTRLGRQSRALAEDRFDIQTITSSFVEQFDIAVGAS